MTRPEHNRAAVLGTLLFVIALIAGACSDAAEPDPTVTSTSATPTTAVTSTAAVPTTSALPETTEAFGKPDGGEAVVAEDQEPLTLNSFAPGGDTAIVATISQGLHAGVQEIDGFTLDLVPELVTELPTVANGGVVVNEDGTMTVRYKIRDEAVWSDGVPISGRDFQFTLETILNPDLPILRGVYEDIIDSSFGPKSFEYTMAEPTTQHELLFGTIIPKHAVEGTDFLKDWNDTMWPSAGPFKFDEWEKGRFIRLVRNENYWKRDPDTGQQLPYLNSIVFRFIPETAAIVNAFRSREVDIIKPVPSNDTIERLQTLTSDGARVEVLSGPTWEHLNFQFGPGRLRRNPDSVNENLNYRKGVAHAINKELIVQEVLAGQLKPLDSFVEVFAPSLSQASWKQYDYDVDAARTFIEAAKIELGVDSISAVFSTTSDNDARVRMSELFVDMFADVGIEYTNELEDRQIFIGDTLPDGEWDMGEWAWRSDPGMTALVGTLDLFDPELGPPGGQNFYRWGTPDSSVINDETVRFAEIRDELNATVDMDVLVPLIAEAEKILADNVVLIPLYARLVAAAVWEDEIGGFKHNPSQASHTWNLEHWYRVD